jgi:predicted TIM-barrel fold metal-dependent hydrolase
VLCQKARGDNLFIDTSSARSILPGLLEWAVREAGVERLLYGTDTPVYYAPMQWIRVVGTDLSEAEKRQILRENAFALFGLESQI